MLATASFALVSEVAADTSVQFGIGYRTDDISSSIKTPCMDHPESKSNLRFKDLEIFTISTRLKSSCDCVYYRVDAQYGWILDGDVRTSDKLTFPLTSAISPSTEYCFINSITHNDVKGKYVADFSIALGYPIEQCWCPNIRVIPTLGFSYDTIRIRSKNRDNFGDGLSSGQIDDLGLSVSSVSSGSGSGNGHNKFRTTWWGPFIGLDFIFCQEECWNVYGEFEYHFGRARRERNTSMHFDFFDHFRRSRSAWGYNLKVGSLYYFNCNWFLDGHISYKKWDSHSHKDSLTWRSWGVGLDLGYTF